MITSEQRQIDSQFPSNSYTKYKNQGNRNLLFHHWENDVGYAQDILKASSATQRHSINYLSHNKRNLRNLFEDRLPPKDAEICRTYETIEPGKLFEIKRKQSQLKSATKTTLENTFSLYQYPVSVPMRKGRSDSENRHQYMQFKKKQLKGGNSKGNIGIEHSKEKMGIWHSKGTINTNRTRKVNNYRRATKSSLHKYSLTPKKQAYSLTFGLESSIIHPRSNRSVHQTAPTPTPRHPKHISQNCQQLNARQKLTETLICLDNYRQQIERDMPGKPYQSRKQEDFTQGPKQQIIGWIQSVTQQQKRSTIKYNQQTLRDLEDLNRLNPLFFKKMNEHKGKRLQQREYQYLQASTLRAVSSTPKHSKQTINLCNSFSSESSQTTVNSQPQINNDNLQSLSTRVVSVKEKFNRFSTLLRLTLHQAYFSGITDFQHAYWAFCQIRQPYELEGSYAFFKAIKNGDIQIVKRFQFLHPQFIYQVNTGYKSSLIYACSHNQLEIARFIIEGGVNTNFKDKNKKNALFYALKNGNRELVQILLEAGCRPWSTQCCSFQQLLALSQDYRIGMLMKNSRRIWLAMMMINERPAKLVFWKKHRHKISDDQIITFH